MEAIRDVPGGSGGATVSVAQGDERIEISYPSGPVDMEYSVTSDDQDSTAHYSWTEDALLLRGVESVRACDYEPPLKMLPRVMLDGDSWHDEGVCGNFTAVVTGTVRWEAGRWVVVRRFATGIGAPSITRLDFDDLDRTPVRVIREGTEETPGTEVHRRLG